MKKVNNLGDLVVPAGKPRRQTKMTDFYGKKAVEPVEHMVQKTMRIFHKSGKRVYTVTVPYSKRNDIKLLLRLCKEQDLNM